MRINQFIARCGITSRRGAEILIKTHRIKINDKVAELQDSVDEHSVVTLDNRRISPKEVTLYKFHKPVCMLVTNHDTKHRSTTGERFTQYPHLMPVGRLDYYTSGLLLLTNDGTLARKLELPSNKFPRKYIIKVNKLPSDTWFHNVREGRYFHLKPIGISSPVSKKKQFTFTLTLYEGKNREIRKLIALEPIKIIQLIRIEYAGIALKNMPVNNLEKIPIPPCLQSLTES